MSKLFFKQDGSLIQLWLSSPEQKINSLAGEIIVPAGVEVNQVSDGNSIVNFWLERPALKDGKITFSGIIPGGYQGDAVVVLTLDLGTKQPTQIKVSNAQVLAHDGLGTRVTVETPVFTLTQVSSGQIITDNILPEDFKPFITSDPEIFAGQKFLVFSTQDKQSGINYYEVREGGEWYKTSSPYLLKNQELTQKIEVRAVDWVGNERIVVAFSPPLGPIYYVFGAIIILVILILCSLAIKKLFSRR